MEEGRESEVFEAMRVVVPHLKDVVLLAEPVRSAAGGPSGILVGTDGERERYPLDSHGDGACRVLALAAAGVRALGGFFLVDEVDTGLHYSALGDIWRFITTAAVVNQNQVFATTHSLDCIRGLAQMCERHPELADEVALHKIEPRLEKAVTIHSDEIEIAVEQEIEVR